MTIQRVEITPESIFGEVGTMTMEELDQLPFGAMQLDVNGTVVKYNRIEERLANRKREDVIGLNFFDQVAPCTRVRQFMGTFASGVSLKQLNEVFDFVFMFPTGAREVRIRMIYSEQSKPGVWIFVTPLNS